MLVTVGEVTEIPVGTGAGGGGLLYFYERNTVGSTEGGVISGSELQPISGTQ